MTKEEAQMIKELMEVVGEISNSLLLISTTVKDAMTKLNAGLQKARNSICNP